MRKSSSLALSAAPVLALALALGACGGSSDNADDSMGAGDDTAMSVDDGMEPGDDAQASDATPGEGEDGAEETVPETPDEEPTPTPTPSTSPTPTASAAPTTAAATAPPMFAVCSACHSVKPGEDGIGPSLAGVFGAKAGQHSAGFEYSDAMKASGLTWNAANLDSYLENPKGVVPGGSMSFNGVKNADQRKAIVAYLKTL